MCGAFSVWRWRFPRLGHGQVRWQLVLLWLCTGLCGLRGYDVGQCAAGMREHGTAWRSVAVPLGFPFQGGRSCAPWRCEVVAAIRQYVVRVAPRLVRAGLLHNQGCVSPTVASVCFLHAMGHGPPGGLVCAPASAPCRLAGGEAGWAEAVPAAGSDILIRPSFSVVQVGLCLWAEGQVGSGAEAEVELSMSACVLCSTAVCLSRRWWCLLPFVGAGLRCRQSSRQGEQCGGVPLTGPISSQQPFLSRFLAPSLVFSCIVFSCFTGCSQLYIDQQFNFGSLGLCFSKFVGLIPFFGGTTFEIDMLILQARPSKIMHNHIIISARRCTSCLSRFCPVSYVLFPVFPSLLVCTCLL